MAPAFVARSLEQSGNGANVPIIVGATVGGLAFIGIVVTVVALARNWIRSRRQQRAVPTIAEPKRHHRQNPSEGSAPLLNLPPGYTDGTEGADTAFDAGASMRSLGSGIPPTTASTTEFPNPYRHAPAAAATTQSLPMNPPIGFSAASTWSLLFAPQASASTTHVNRTADSALPTRLQAGSSNSLLPAVPGRFQFPPSSFSLATPKK